MSLAPGSYENWRGYINETIPIPSYWAYTGYILAPGPFEDWRGTVYILYIRVHFIGLMIDYNYFYCNGINSNVYIIIYIYLK